MLLKAGFRNSEYSQILSGSTVVAEITYKNIVFILGDIFPVVVTKILDSNNFFN